MLFEIILTEIPNGQDFECAKWCMKCSVGFHTQGLNTLYLTIVYRQNNK